MSAGARIGSGKRWRSDGFHFTPEQEELRARVRASAEAELAPTVKDRDERQVCERAVWDALARAGLAGLAVPPEYGGEGRSFFDYILALEEVGKVESAQVLILASHAAHDHLRPAAGDRRAEGALAAAPGERRIVRLLQPDRAGRGQRPREHEDGRRARRRRAMC